MNKVLTRIVATAAGLIGLAGSLVVVAAPAEAVGCFAGSCTGKDPEVQGCSADATTVSSFNGHYQNNLGAAVYVELRQSKACRARWARVKSGDSDWGCGGGTRPYIRVQSLTSGGSVISTQVKEFSACGPFPKYTAMVGHSASALQTSYGFIEQYYGWCSDSFYHPCKTLGWPQPTG